MREYHDLKTYFANFTDTFRLLYQKMEGADLKSFSNGFGSHEIGVKLTTGYKCSILSSKMRIYAVWQYL